jgi:hypothetical protein
LPVLAVAQFHGRKLQSPPRTQEGL